MLAIVGWHSRTPNPEPLAMAQSIIGILLITFVVFLVIWATGRATLGE
jgi:CHASE2 domain-containing sensor protein